jgi:hypothetical protein
MSESTTALLDVEAIEATDGFNSRAHFEAFLARLARMSVEERIRAARNGGFTAWERSVWAARFPRQVPLVNGEFEWIALGLADLD